MSSKFPSDRGLDLELVEVETGPALRIDTAAVAAVESALLDHFTRRETHPEPCVPGRALTFSMLDLCRMRDNDSFGTFTVRCCDTGREKSVYGLLLNGWYADRLTLEDIPGYVFMGEVEFAGQTYAEYSIGDGSQQLTLLLGRDMRVRMQRRHT